MILYILFWVDLFEFGIKQSIFKLDLQNICKVSKIPFLLKKIIYFDYFKIFLYIFLYLIFLYFLKINKIF
jgi:hypothetical protein